MEVKPNTGVLFKNDRATEERHPDYTGTWIDESGSECYLDAWKNESKGGKSYLRLRMGKLKQQTNATFTAQQAPAPAAAVLDDDIPF